jgi:drug/metabolite transporter (DMT)-like permease
MSEPVTERPRLAIIGAAALWSTGGAAIKLSSATAPQLAAGRAVVAALALFLAMPSARMRWNKPILITAVFYACTCTLYVFANTLTTAGNTIFIQNIAPVWVLALGPVVLREYPTRWEKISVPVSLFGCLLFFLDDMSPGRMAGNLCALAASVSYAALILAYRKISEREGLAATIAGNCLIAVVLGPLLLSGTMPAPIDFAVFFYLGAIQQAFAAVLFVRGIRGVSALEGALLTLFEPLLSPVWAFILVGETLGPKALLGACLILGATVVRGLSASSRWTSTS